MPPSRSVRRRVIERAMERCEYCQMVGWPLSVDHVIPRSSRTGEVSAESIENLDDPENLAAACMLCNRAKWDTRTAADPLSSERVTLFNPRRQRWSAEFTWLADYTIILGRTAIGRATVAALGVNRRPYQFQRRILRGAAAAGVIV
jgi:HNH endonuclease